MLTASQQGIMVIDALNRLPTLDDYLNPDINSADGCCPKCCAPCGVLEDLDREGLLDSVVTWAPNFMWQLTSWWRKGEVDRVWLYAVWDCQGSPRCETDNDRTPQADIDVIAQRLARRTRVTAPEAYSRLQERLSFEEQHFNPSGEQLIPIHVQP